MNPIELENLRCLVVLAEELNFGRAAARLHMSQPPLTRIVAETERIIGARLFERTTRRVSLTPIGTVFINEACTLLAHADTALENIRTAIRRQSGQLRLAYTPLALQTVLPRILSQLRAYDHDVSIDLIELPASAQKEALLSGQADMSFTSEPIFAAGFSNLLLLEQPLQVLLLASHPLATRPSLRITDLVQEAFILHARSDYPRYYDRVIAACNEAGYTPRIHHRQEKQNCMALVSSGLGILLSPALFHPLEVSGLRSIPLEIPLQSLSSEVWAILPEASPLPHIEALNAILKRERKAFS